MALVVGGSGLLGRVIMQRLGCKGTHWQHPSRNTTQFDPDDLKNYSVIINCVAEKNVDRCESNFAKAKMINSDFVDILVKANPKAHLIQISTEYVYNDGRIVDPQNVYGVTKYLGELKAQRAQHWSVLRVPVLYNDPTDVICTNLTRSMVEVTDAKRYHTSCEDVAEAVFQIMTRKMYGTFNFSASIARSRMDLVECLNLPVSGVWSAGAPRFNHVYVGNDFNILPRELDLESFVIPRDHKVFMILDLDGTLLDTVQLHANCYEKAGGNRDLKTKYLKQITDIELRWNADTLIDYIHRHDINHVVLTNTTMDVVDHFRKCVPKLKLLKRFVTREQYSKPKPDPEPYNKAMEYHQGEKVMVFDDVCVNLNAMRDRTRLLFHMSDQVHDRTVYTLSDFARLVYALGG